MNIVFCTVPDKEKASEIAEILINERIAACVNIVKVDESVYRWEGKLVKEPEYLLIVKTRKGNWEKLEKRIAEVHPCSVPEIASIKADNVAEPYLRWVYGETK